MEELGGEARLAAEQPCETNEGLKVVWPVVQALCAHDDRLDVLINQLDLNKTTAGRVTIVETGRGGISGDAEKDGESKPGADPLALQFGIDEWRDSIYARIVERAGQRRSWQTWAEDVAEIAQQHIVRIKGLLADESSASDRTGLRREEIVESTRARRGLVIDLQTAILMAIGGPGVVWTDWEWSA